MISEHFEGKFEVELKYRLKSKSQFLTILKSMTHEVMLQDNLESDCYFDTAEQHLLSENKSLCIREMEPSGIKLWIVKGPEADRCEATNITDANKAKSMLKTMGYHIVLAMKKTRSIYFVGKFHITVDNLDGLGDFAEFAIMTDDDSLLDGYRSELIILANKFGLGSTDIEHRSYRKIYSESIKM
ncbi:class IV adenylate cyclase [Photobacterium kishitanii]|uniref:class IV adenylate cyclase n=1 Tax=Photobacterium kishitanii TaxID=318456 RepID=UPI000D15A53E|nr:class IV adenylate cyclase [Photobacterium kishitanii]PSU88143.1 class IV adenylate cyclase [Photobacterium kishitanii]